MSERPTVISYYFPNYHPDPRNEALHGVGWTEWKLVKEARPRFEGHRQPRVPLWGYEDESDPKVMAKKIDAAADHGIDGFVYAWYWYDDGPFLEGCLDRGFLHARNNDRLKFAIMWTNHTWSDIHPAKHPFVDSPILYPGPVTRQTFDTIVEHAIKHYFTHPSYWKIDGCPYFSIWDTKEFMEGLGGMESAREALDDFRAKTKAAGFPGLHLHFMLKNRQVLAHEKAADDQAFLIDTLGFSSAGPYVWLYDVPLPTFPATPYRYAAEEIVKHWAQWVEELKAPYFPNVTVGWDPSPRAEQSQPFTEKSYPFCATLNDSTPEVFKQALIRAKRFLESCKTETKVVTINCWNEWTEGSYLEPDTTYGMGYLQAIEEVFGRDKVENSAP